MHSHMLLLFANPVKSGSLGQSSLRTCVDLSISSTTPVAAILNLASTSATVCTASSPVLCGVIGAQMVASQCRCSGVYLSARCLMLCSVMDSTGIVWKRRHPNDMIKGSRVFRIFGYHRCFFKRTCTYLKCRAICCCGLMTLLFNNALHYIQAHCIHARMYLQNNVWISNNVSCNRALPC